MNNGKGIWLVLQSQIPGVMGQYKRVAVADAKGFPMYQPISNVSYQAAIAAMQFQQPQYIPGVSCKYLENSRLYLST